MDEGLLCPKLLVRQMEREREEMRLPQRKPITYMTSEQLEAALKPHFGSKENGSYFIGFGVGPGWSDIILDLHMKLVKRATRLQNSPGFKREVCWSALLRGWHDR